MREAVVRLKALRARYKLCDGLSARKASPLACEAGAGVPGSNQPEERAREEIDRLLIAAGWAVQRVGEAHIHAARGVAIREFPLDSGFGFADYLLYVDAKACGVVEAKKKGATLTGVEVQSSRYAQGLPAALPAWTRPLPFIYESTGVETHFTNG
jgi:type I restriction enzyme R subunit